RETYVRHLVEVIELLHHHLADLARRNLALAQRQDLLHDPIHRRVDLLGRNGTLVQRAREAVADLGRIEIRARAIGLDDLRQAQLGILVRGEALLAVLAAAPAANAVARLGHARIDDLRLAAAAERALHFQLSGFSNRQRQSQTG